MPAKFTQKLAFAKALGIAKSTLTVLTQRDDWPLKTSAPPWTTTDLATVKKWRAGLQEDRSGKGADSGMSERQQVEIGLKRQRMRIAQAQADKMEAEVISRDHAYRAIMAIAKLVREAHDEMRETLVHELPGDKLAVQAVVNRRFDEFMRRLAMEEDLSLDVIDDVAMQAKMNRRKQ